MKQEIRLIGGLYRGKKLHFPDVEGLRPTPDRVRETLFNWLMHEIKDARCLDAFAGSGALGFEAFSRGAASVLFLEQDAKAHHNLKKIIQNFNTDKLKALKLNACNYLNGPNQAFDVIFLDPPFTLNLLPQCLEFITSHQLLTPRGVVYMESANPFLIDETQWKIRKIKQAGQVYYGLFEQLS